MSGLLYLLQSRPTTARIVGLAILMAVALTAVAGVSLVAAQQDEPVDPAATEVFDACVNNHNGNLRLISPDQDCRGQETRIQLGGAATDTALLDRIAALEATTASQQTLIETQQGQIDTLLADVGTLHQEMTDLQSAIGTLTQQHADQLLAIDSLEEENGDREREIMTLEGQLGDLSAAHAALQAQVPGCLSAEGTEVYFTGCNVNIRDGSGTTDGAVNGLGNLIVGYNETEGTDTRTGSHNLVVGTGHTYSSYGGLVAGFNNTISDIFTNVTGGFNNIASGGFSSVSGGTDNVASGDRASISGGTDNTASGQISSVSAGSNNTARGFLSSVSGGLMNQATGVASNVSGGRTNTASGNYSSVSGGSSNIASASSSSVSGGHQNQATNAGSSVSGGHGNAANGTYSSISGGADGSVGGDYDWRAGDDFFTEE